MQRLRIVFYYFGLVLLGLGSAVGAGVCIASFMQRHFSLTALFLTVCWAYLAWCFRCKLKELGDEARDASHEATSQHS